jgi:hypothetical protein
MPAVRRLAAILAADVAGYSRLMGADEEGTHERLKAHRRELIEPKISEHSGRIVKTTGDGLLVEFPSVLDAVRCAAELQRAMIDLTRGPQMLDGEPPVGLYERFLYADAYPLMTRRAQPSVPSPSALAGVLAPEGLFQARFRSQQQFLRSSSQTAL